jgi:hypothetical protein
MVKKIFIFSGHGQEALAQLPKFRDYFYVRSADDLRGYNKIACVFLDEWRKHSHYEEIVNALQHITYLSIPLDMLPEYIEMFEKARWWDSKVG